MRKSNEQITNTTSRFCPVCETNQDSFSPNGPTPRPDAMCKHCGALERHRFFWLYLIREKKLFENLPKIALHVAPERQFEELFRKRLGERYITADLFDPNVDITMDITNIQYPDNAFDFIYCSHVLEHVEDDRKAISEFKRVLSPKGTAIILVPITTAQTFEDPSITDPEERLRLFGQVDHVRRYGPDFEDRLKAGGFAVKKVIPTDFLSEEEIIRMGITKLAGEIYDCSSGS